MKFFRNELFFSVFIISHILHINIPNFFFKIKIKVTVKTVEGYSSISLIALICEAPYILYNLVSVTFAVCVVAIMLTIRCTQYAHWLRIYAKYHKTLNLHLLRVKE